MFQRTKTDSPKKIRNCQNVMSEIWGRRSGPAMKIVHKAVAAGVILQAGR
jgi:hypothetical protein